MFVSAKEEIQAGTDEKERYFTNFDEILIRELVYDDSCYEMFAALAYEGRLRMEDEVDQFAGEEFGIGFRI